MSPTSRYPVLSLVPSTALAAALLDGSRLRLRIEFTYLNHTQAKVVTFPGSYVTDFRTILPPATFAVMGACYAVELAEDKSVRLTVDGREFNSDPILQRFMDKHHRYLFSRLDRLANELRTLGDVARMPAYVELLLEDKLRRLLSLQRFDLMEPGKLRIRVGCSDCLEAIFGGAILQTSSNGFVGRLMEMAREDEYVRGYDAYFSGTWDWNQIVAGFSVPHEELLYAPALHTLLEDALNVTLRKIERDKLDAFFGTMLVGNTKRGQPIA